MLTDKYQFFVVFLAVMSRGPHTEGSGINGRGGQNIHSACTVLLKTLTLPQTPLFAVKACPVVIGWYPLRNLAHGVWTELRINQPQMWTAREDYQHQDYFTVGCRVSGRVVDFLVVCRLRRNNEFRQHSCSNRASSSQMNLSSLQAHSSEQVDSTESNQKDAAEITHVESDDHDQKDFGSDDFYSDILKDDIINLDTAPFNGASDPLPLIFQRSDTERRSQHEENDVFEWLQNQGSANRRIRLKKREATGGKKLESMKIRDCRNKVEKARLCSTEECESRLMNPDSCGSILRGYYVRVVIFFLLILMALFMSRWKVFGMPKGLC
ncbi:NAC domain-containing protein 89-like isoform X3 [Cucumis melo var. makuwa]|uniref:NAC domain-containing protein 89-like isoform X3 n=1 Tax=Cucumis melo var. makuwa TaxID=1194695 RepID=A0A5D3E504_CUCMM|nr:NAC domain-containing protein 89-like isoform X3 [Cucumis melo var. makuwa]